MVQLYYYNSDKVKFEAIYFVENNSQLSTRKLIYFHLNKIYIYYNYKKEVAYSNNNGMIIGPSKTTIKTQQYLNDIFQESLGLIDEFSPNYLEFDNLKKLIKTLKKDKTLNKNSNLNYIVQKKSNFRKIGVYKW